MRIADLKELLAYYQIQKEDRDEREWRDAIDQNAAKRSRSFHQE